jgi:predicted MFS family arabinose efflux permease
VRPADDRPGIGDHPKTAGPSARAGLAPVAVGIVAAILPVFLLGSLSFQIRSDLGYGEATAGVVLAGFFAASAVVSSRLGRWVDSVGSRRALGTALAGTTLVQLAIAGLARGPLVLGVLVAAAGVFNATAQLGANVFIARGLAPRRQGIGFAVKQSAMPGASLVAGLALPAIALPFGWRWAFALASAFTLAALAVVRARVPAVVPSGPAAPAGRSSVAAGVDRRPPAGLVPMAVAAAFATAAAITLGGFFVESAIDAGVAAGTAGVVFSVGSVVSIAVRLSVGALADRRRGDLLGVVAGMLVLGALTSIWFTWRTPTAHLVGVPLAFGAGWAWPGLFNLSVVRAAPDFPGRATGITQTGTYIGGAAGPIVFGTVAESASFAAAWWLASALGLAASVAVLVGRRALVAGQTVTTDVPVRPVDL